MEKLKNEKMQAKTEQKNGEKGFNYIGDCVIAPNNEINKKQQSSK